MKHNYRQDADSDQAKAFLSWLESDTANALKAGHGNVDAVRSSIFLYVNRAYEAGMPDDLVGQLFGESIARAGYTEEEQEAVIEVLESFAPIAKQVHAANSA